MDIPEKLSSHMVFLFVHETIHVSLVITVKVIMFQQLMK